MSGLEKLPPPVNRRCYRRFGTHHVERSALQEVLQEVIDQMRVAVEQTSQQRLQANVMGLLGLQVPVVPESSEQAKRRS